MKQVRLITVSDNPFIRDIIISVMTEFGCNGPGYSINDSEVNTMSKFYQAQDKAGYFVAETNDGIVGGSGIARLVGASGDVCELKKMYILSKGRGLNLGQMLMDECEKLARIFKYQGIYLETTPQMEAAQGLYLKNGFEEISEPMGNTGHFSCDKYFYKSLI